MVAKLTTRRSFSLARNSGFESRLVLRRLSHSESHSDRPSPSPLEGVKVLDLTRVLAGPYCTMILGDLGAEVIKVEHPQGDETRTWGPPFVEGDGGGRESCYFLSTNRNKKSVCINFKTKEGPFQVYSKEVINEIICRILPQESIC